MKTLYRRVAGIDVHRVKHMATILIEQADGSTEAHTREFGGFKRDLRWLVAWLQRDAVELVAMESTGLLGGAEPSVLIELAKGRLKAKREELQLALDGELSARHLFLLQSLQGHIRQLQAQLDELDGYRIAAMAPYRWALELLQTIPGIDAIAAALILVEIGDDMHRFGSADRLASWAAPCPGNHESAGKRQGGKTRKGNSLVRYLLCEAANAARRTKGVFASKYQGLAIRRGHKKAIVALAHKLIRTIYVILSRREPYRDSGTDYQAAAVSKNAPRWIRALKQFGYWPTQTMVTA